MTRGGLERTGILLYISVILNRVRVTTSSAYKVSVCQVAMEVEKIFDELLVLNPTPVAQREHP